MKTLLTTVEHDESGFTIYTDNEIFSGLGDTLEEARANMEEQIRLYVEVMKEQEKKYPDYLDGGYQIKFKFNVQDLLELYDGIIGLTALEKLTGISAKQLWTYKQGTKPHRAQLKKLEEGLHRLGSELCAIAL